MERTIAILRKAIYDMEAPMKLAQTRLEERTRRIHVENCNDPAMQGFALSFSSAVNISVTFFFTVQQKRV